MARDPGLKVHMYGKDVRPGRKVGPRHRLGDDLTDLLDAPTTRPTTSRE
jgi:5-(carboxyamino)imidazole ribonucleotide synthase